MQNIFKIFAVFLLLTTFPTDLEAKKSSKSWGSFSKKKSSKSKSYSSDISSRSKKTSFDLAREKKEKKTKSYEAYKKYSQTQESFNSQSSKTKELETTSSATKQFDDFNSKNKFYKDKFNKYTNNNYTSSISYQDFYRQKNNFYDRNRYYDNVSHKYNSNFGVWDSKYLWALLGASPFLIAEIFYNHPNDDGLEQFKSVVENEALTNQNIATQLQEMNHRLYELENTNSPVDESYLPPNTTITQAFSEDFLKENGKIIQSENQDSLNSINDFFTYVIFIGILLFFVYMIFKIFKKKNSENSQNSNEFDEVKKIDSKELPLGLRLNGLIDVSSINTQLILNRNILEIKDLTSLKGYIASIGEVNLDSNLKIYKVYVSENVDEEDVIFRIEIEMINQTISNIKIFKNYAEIYPETAEEWREWLEGDDENYPNIGGLDFSTPNGKFYTRIWQEDSEETIRYNYTEYRYIKSFDEKPQIIEHSATLYGRDLDSMNTKEYLLASHFVNHKAEESLISIDLGLEIKTADLNII